jgi:squalene-hopene/tetraprenyl-beta-curcumene cyclase/sporulenol synthase
MFGPDRMVRAPVAGRVLESALLLHLTERLVPAHPARDRLVRFLKHSLDTAPPDGIQEAVARAALGEVSAGSVGADGELAGFAHFTAGRKRLMFHTLLAALDAIPYPQVPFETYTAAGQQSWLRVQMTAMKAVAAYGRGCPGVVTERDWEVLAPVVGADAVWEGNYLARLLALLALLRHPARRPEAVACTERTLRDLGPDGGLPFITGMDVFTTALAGLALRSAGCADTALLDGAADALAPLQHDDGGFGFTREVRQSDTDDTSYCLEFLRVTAPLRHARAVRRAEEYLLAQRNDDGGFPTYARGVASEAAMTAGAVNALAPSPRCRAAVTEGLRYLTGRPGAARAPERSWSRNTTNAAFRTVLACRAAGQDQPDRQGALRRHLLDYLVGAQHPDGGFGHEDDGPSDPISTAYAAVALSHAPHRSPVWSSALEATVEYLVRQQRPDGGFVSVPDQAGPRPLLYDTPALADVCVLLGLGHALAPCSATGAGPLASQRRSPANTCG